MWSAGLSASAAQTLVEVHRLWVDVAVRLVGFDDAASARPWLLPRQRGCPPGRGRACGLGRGSRRRAMPSHLGPLPRSPAWGHRSIACVASRWAASDTTDVMCADRPSLKIHSHSTLGALERKPTDAFQRRRVDLLESVRVRMNRTRLEGLTRATGSRSSPGRPRGRGRPDSAEGESCRPPLVPDTIVPCSPSG